MEPEKVQELYGERYAEQYEQLWQHNPVWAPEAAHYVQSLGEQIREGTRWLDVGCGTGWFLSQFPGVERGGIDLSPAMLAQARKNNPDALFLRQGDIRDDVPEWHDAWDLVSSTGQAWCYVDTMADIQRIAENMARWTAPNGVCMVGAADIFDIAGLVIPMHMPHEPPVTGSARITAAVWNFYDEAGVHEHMIWPSIDVWLGWLAPHFNRIDVVIWPHDPPYPYLHGGRRLVLASRKRRPGDDAPAEIVVHPAPETVGSEEPGDTEPQPTVTEMPAPVPVPASSPPAPEPEPQPDPEPEPATDAGVPELSPPDHAEPGLPPGRLPGRGIYDQPLSYLVSRARPWDPAFWRSARRRARRIMRGR
jgi:SAM-dependent methyltransferase